MDIVKVSSCSIILGLALPYLMKNNNQDENVEHRFEINRTPIRINNQLQKLNELRNQTLYSIIGAVSGMVIGKFI
tara:strand:- start:279 stop:503 length:225 start_codon:yes stop_codon:yes gene_type:complete